MPYPDEECSVPERDLEMREGLSHTLRDAAERATFHRFEAERWERVGRAAGAALVQLDSHTPVAEVTAEELVERARPSKLAQVHPSSGQVVA